MLIEIEAKITSQIEGEAHFDAFTCGRYSTDASIYQMTPIGVVIPKTIEDIKTTLTIAREHSIHVTARGGGSSQCGQTVNNGLIIDCSKFMNKILDIDVANRTAIVEPGIVLDDLNKALKQHGLWFPVDVSTGSRATIGGMAANNSCGSRSIKYGLMRDNVIAIDAILADGSNATFGSTSIEQNGRDTNNPAHQLFDYLLTLGANNKDVINKGFPDIMRRVGGYNIDALIPTDALNNMSHLLVGSEGTLGFSTAITLKLSPIPVNKVVAVCHFPTFFSAMDAAQHIVDLGPTAVELMDNTMIDLARDIDIFKPLIKKFVKGNPAAVLFVEFAENDQDENLIRLKKLDDLMNTLGFNWDNPNETRGGIVEALDPGFQKQVWDVRKQALNIMMSMKSDGKPVSFVEDCAVPLEDLAEYTQRLTDIFHKNNTEGTWYAHASVGTLHVRPILNLKLEQDANAMRAIAEECFDMVKAYKGSHSGEHGDGIVRSEFHAKMFGDEMVSLFEQIKDRMDPEGLFNPGKIVRPPKMDDRSLFRYSKEYSVPKMNSALDWNGYSGAGGGFQGAIEMCNNNGACRKTDASVMCPSYRVTKNERDLTRGRANTLRLAISGQLGPDALTSDEMADTMKLCVSCKGCKLECPTGVDMSRMKIEVLAARAKRHGISLHDRLVANLPRYAPYAARIPWLLNLRDKIPGMAKLSEWIADFAAERSLPNWSTNSFKNNEFTSKQKGPEVVLFADTFNRYFEPENIRAAIRVLDAAGYRVIIAKPVDKGRPLCSGRTFLSAGLVDQAKAELQRSLDSLKPFAVRDVPIIGLEPSCLFTFRDELGAIIPGDLSQKIAANTFLFEEFIAREISNGTFKLPLASLGKKRAYLHGHCHQKAFGVMDAVQSVLSLVPDLEVTPIESSCCGMAGAFGYHKDTIDTSKAMAELSLLPALRKAQPDDLVIADGTSCRHQIDDGSTHQALHVARILDLSLSMK